MKYILLIAYFILAGLFSILVFQQFGVFLGILSLLALGIVGTYMTSIFPKE